MWRGQQVHVCVSWSGRCGAGSNAGHHEEVCLSATSCLANSPPAYPATLAELAPSCFASAATSPCFGLLAASGKLLRRDAGLPVHISVVVPSPRSDRVDYMFFRNHMPSEAKLSVELKGSEGGRLMGSGSP